MADPIEEAALAIDSNEVNVTVLRLALRSLIEHARALERRVDAERVVLEQVKINGEPALEFLATRILKGENK